MPLTERAIELLQAMSQASAREGNQLSIEAVHMRGLASNNSPFSTHFRGLLSQCGVVTHQRNGSSTVWFVSRKGLALLAVLQGNWSALQKVTPQGSCSGLIRQTSTVGSRCEFLVTWHTWAPVELQPSEPDDTSHSIIVDLAAADKLETQPDNTVRIELDTTVITLGHSQSPLAKRLSQKTPEATAG
jgi:hypothetical protein